MNGGSQASQGWLQSHYALKMVKGYLSLLLVASSLAWVGRGEKGGSAAGGPLPGWGCSTREVLTGREEKAHSEHLGSSPATSHPMKFQPKKAEVLAVGVLHCWRASPARHCLSRRCSEMLTFILPDTNSTQGESGLRGTLCFPS